MKRRIFFKYLAGIYGLFSFNLLADDTKISKLQKQSSKMDKLKKLCIIGVGGGGTNILDDISALDNAHTFIYANSDYNLLKQKKSKHKILLDSSLKDELSCSGKEHGGKSIVDNDVKDKLKELTKNMETVHVISTLSGRVGSCFTPEIVECLKSIDKKVIVFVTIPFSFEGKERSSIAYNAVEKIKIYADELMIFQNDDLLQKNKTLSLSLKDTFKLTSKNMFNIMKTQNMV
ncbi:MAG: hypothetical protein WC667_13065 [Sulfurimonas sp.]|jgi:cell division protein FtsZ